MRRAPRTVPLALFALLWAMIAVPPAAQASHEPDLSINNVSVTEGDSGTTNASFTVTLADDSDETVTVDFDTAEGTADSPSDFLDESGTVEFDPGDTSETITISVVGDTIDEPNETFFVELSDAEGADIDDGTGTGTILDDDGDDDEVDVGVGRAECDIVGTVGNDELQGDGDDEVICGLAGNDVIGGGGGDDVLWGGPGSDELDGEEGDDVLRGGNGRDELADGSGDDELRGGNGPDGLDADDGDADDALQGGLGPDECDADPGDDVSGC